LLRRADAAFPLQFVLGAVCAYSYETLEYEDVDHKDVGNRTKETDETVLGRADTAFPLNSFSSASGFVVVGVGERLPKLTKES